ncbi:unnamed protein product [Acanthoscelides obtectus]|uniref:Uncharacterized protein n=1 Tax=Acanthoscelides obtectus TaxID=200917 RepID=A0A9P0KQN3_ACAOB|nr:unnamed protein product [Acanthoscelides obtectus]CAK1656096.1 hypothetical protein AOBTE_LOCUS19570 [Acanthoscelides obtectus]
MRFLSSLILCLILHILFIALIYLLFTGYSWMKSCITCPAHQMKSNMSILPQHYQHQKVIILLKLLGYKNICLIRKKVRGERRLETSRLNNIKLTLGLKRSYYH